MNRKKNAMPKSFVTETRSLTVKLGSGRVSIAVRDDPARIEFRKLAEGHEVGESVAVSKSVPFLVIEGSSPSLKVLAEKVVEAQMEAEAAEAGLQVEWVPANGPQ